MKQTLRLICLSTLVSLGGFAGAQPLAVTVMEGQGFHATLIGLLSALVFGGVLLLAPFQPALAVRFGAMATYQAGKAVAVVGFLGCASAVAAWHWAVAFLLLGFGGALTWPLTDSLIATQAPADQKGAWLGLFQAGMGIAFAVGPFVSAVFATWPRALFLGAAGMLVLSSLPLLGKHLPVAEEDDSVESAPWAAWRRAGWLGGVALLGGFFENGTHTAGTLAALELGWSSATAVALAGVMALGSFAIQQPLGRAADRQGTRSMIIWAMGVLVLSLAALPLISLWQPLMWGLGLVWGGASGALYTLAMTGAAQVFTGRDVAAVTTLIVLGYTAGSALGPIAGGLAVDLSPITGIAWIFGSLALAGWALALGRKSLG